LESLRFTLLSDGPSDRALQPVLRWLLEQAGVRAGIEGYWADPRALARPPKTLARRIITALRLHPCDLLFVHRDAEGESPTNRRVEIAQAIEEARVNHLPSICVIPVRMTEAWFLFDEFGIRSAAGNPRGSSKLQLPRTREVESLPDPKALLHQLLQTASGLSGRRLKGFPINNRIYRLADSLETFAPLRALQAFQALENDVQQMVRDHGWDS
jgi:hypothetical protein